ncbi:MAG TPA: gliding motility protein GldN [Chitinophagaceae bacterium]|nr:gliding motility protein GldN [Chitinophagaceae bacterium]
MKYKFLKFSIFAAAMIIMVSAEAQRGRGRTTRGSTTQPDTTKQNQSVQQNTNPANVQKYNPYGNVPIEMAPQSGGFNDTTKASLRRDAAVERSMFKDRIPLDYEFLRADDALYTQRVWREIDIREKINLPFRYQAQDDNGDQRFVSILVKAVRDQLKNGNAIAFDANDDRFTTFLDSAAFEKAVSGGAGQCDTNAVYDLNDPTKIVKYVVDCNKVNPDDIVKFRIKEEWVFDREASRMFVRILGIAPMKTIMGPDGITERSATPLFWIYYPDIRATLARYEVYNPKNMGVSRMTWEELFEARMFGSYIIKSTLDNPMNKYIRNLINDPILRLLEGDNIKDKIFNYEQNLWQY